MKRKPPNRKQQLAALKKESELALIDMISCCDQTEDYKQGKAEEEGIE